ncbi:peptide chain release factor 2 [Eubacterium saphenum ATCC 49989]|nr:peptide chain release factor 2 [Eubacterium saphenum ATCC 49989]
MAAKILLKEKQEVEVVVSQYDELLLLIDDAKTLQAMVSEGLVEEDMEMLATDIFKKLEAGYHKLKVTTLLAGKHDKANAYISIHSGSGGSDAQDWGKMLLRMYTRWAENKGFQIDVIDLNQNGVAGFKSATLLIKGLNAYGYLKKERGVHRLVRISPFDSSSRRHTSFASVDVIPEIKTDKVIKIDDKDLRIDKFRASGAGGQHVNKTDSAVRIIHLPTKIVVTCQNERSQHMNKEAAMHMLISKLMELKEKEHKESINDLTGDYNQITWGSQIRSYVFHPYRMVKDHRTGAEMGNVDAVMDGDLDYFIQMELSKLTDDK